MLLCFYQVIGINVKGLTSRYVTILANRYDVELRGWMPLSINTYCDDLYVTAYQVDVGLSATSAIGCRTIASFFPKV